MPYVVEQLDKESAAGRNVVPETTVRYLSANDSDKIVSTLELWEEEIPTATGFAIKIRARRAFGSVSDYSAVLIQNEEMVFVLHKSESLQDAKDALEAIRGVVAPLISGGSVLLTTELLEGLILPTPRDPAQLASYLVELMESKPNAHPHWDKMLLALARSTLLTETSPSQEDSEALRKAFKDDKQDDVLELMGKGTRLSLAVEGNEDASNPLHLAAIAGSHNAVSLAYKQVVQLDPTCPKSIDLLIALNVHVPEKEGNTPLMLAVQHKKLDTAAALLIAGAKPNIRNPVNGYTALHYAAEQGNVELAMLLTIFLANLKATNNDGKTPLDLAPIGGDCSLFIQRTIEITDTAAAIDVSDTFRRVSIPRNSTFLLACDGGAAKSLITLQILMALQKRMKQLRPDCGHIKSYFDYVAGTSVGSLIVLGFVYQNATPEMLTGAIFQLSQHVITGDTPYSSDKMEKILKETLGDAKMTSVEKPRVITTTVLGDQDPPTLCLMCNYGGPRPGPKDPSEMEVWEAGRASSAAPMYFEAFEGKWLDGGVIANNPTLTALTEITNQGEKEGKRAKIGLVLSLGTGIPPTKTYKEVSTYIPHLGLKSIGHAITHLSDVVSGDLHTINQFISVATQSDGIVVEQARAWCKNMPGAVYRRFSPQLPNRYGIGEVDTPTLIAIMYEGFKYALQNKTEIDEVAKILLSRGPVK